MEATYYKDTMRSYMIIPCPEEAETENYQYRMLEMNRITGLLPCGLRHIDGMRYLYYDITGKQSMQSLYEGRKISGTEFLRLIRELDRVSESISGYLLDEQHLILSISGYLLDEQHLILSQEQVFYELQTGNYYFTYYPGEIMPPEIFRFLADSIDGTDKSTAAAAYRLSSVARGDRQTLREAIREEAAEKEDLPYPYEASVGVETYKGGRSIRNSSVYGGNFRQEEFMDADEEQEQMISEEANPADRNGACPAEGITGKGRKKKKKRHAKDSDIKKPLTDRAVREEAGGISSSDKKSIVIRIILILFALCGAGGL